jgi:nicotinamide riboside kinase
MTSRCRKVAFIGSHGVGKTTLCYELAARLKRRDLHVDLVKEVARRCPLPINRESTLEAQAWIIHTQMAMEIETCRDHDVVVCDRSVLDNYAYLVAACGRLPVYDELVRSWLPTYDLTAWVPVLTQPSFDGVRDTDRRFQHQIEDVIRSLVQDLGLRPLRLHGLDREQWIEHVLEHLPLGGAQLPLFGDEPAR